MKPIKTIEEWCEFGEYRAYILMAIARRKFNDELTHNTEIIHRKVIGEREDIEDCYNQLQALMDMHNLHFRVYLSVNARNTLDAYSTFNNRMNNWAVGLIRDDVGIPPKLKKVSSYWKSELHKPKSKDDSYFLFDLDEKYGKDELCQDLRQHTDVVMTQRTPNGWHIVTEPFNHTQLKTGVGYDEMDTDGQLFIEEVDNRKKSARQIMKEDEERNKEAYIRMGEIELE